MVGFGYKQAWLAVRGVDAAEVGAALGLRDLGPVPWRQGFRLVDQHLASVGRTRSALCAVELRSPTQFSFAGFSEFNAGYCAVLFSWVGYAELLDVHSFLVS